MDGLGLDGTKIFDMNNNGMVGMVVMMALFVSVMYTTIHMYIWHHHTYYTRGVELTQATLSFTTVQIGSNLVGKAVW